jgi:ferritin-like metal-binding protein YciE
MNTSTLRDLTIDELKDLYNAENQLVKALPKMAKAATSEELSSAFEQHLEQTRGHVERLDRIFDELEVAPRGKRCVGMEGIIEEGKELLDGSLEAETLDAAIIGAAQKVEHYEIAAYGTVRAHVELLGMDEAVKLLDQTLDEEKQTDARLTELAATINQDAELDDSEGAGNGATEKNKAARNAKRRVAVSR